LVSNKEKTMKRFIISGILSLLALNLSADEGMWTFDQLPTSKIASKYGVRLSQDQIDLMRLASLRVSLGGSASFVSSNGLVLTNHHVAYKAIDNLSSENQNLIKNGFYATSLDKELICPNVHLDKLISIQDVTDQINQATKDLTTAQSREEKRKELLISLKEEAEAKSGLHAEVVTLFKGAKYQIYLYKRYTDVRLVMAPEQQVAFFGGDEMNFEFPRTNFDFAFLRVYENGQPLKVDTYFKWSPRGPVEGEAIFVIGNPGMTTRIFTADNLKYQRDCEMPFILDYIKGRSELLENFSEASEDHARQAQTAYKTLKNTEKVLSAKLEGLKGPDIIRNKEKEEKKLLAKLSSKDKEPWLTLSASLNDNKTLSEQYGTVERLAFLFSKTYNYAKTLVRAAAERRLPNEKRLKEFVDSELPSVERLLGSTEPAFEAFEACILEAGFKMLSLILKEDHPLIKQIKNGPAASQIAKETKLYDPLFRKELYDNPEMVLSCKDPMIELALAIDPIARDLRKQFEDRVEATVKESYSAIANTLYTYSKGDLYPDATFTPRLSYGTMKGYRENKVWVKPVCKLGELYDTFALKKGIAPYDLPMEWAQDEKKLSRSVAVNFVSTNDITGGNSGSPAVNKKGELVGLIFDGNKESLIWDIAFDDTAGRSISVHSDAIIYSLEHVYKAQRLIEELK
jgi:hypothetical protein